MLAAKLAEAAGVATSTSGSWKSWRRTEPPTRRPPAKPSCICAARTCGTRSARWRSSASLRVSWRSAPGARTGDYLWQSATANSIKAMSAAMATTSRADVVKILANPDRHWTERLADLASFDGGRGVADAAAAMGFAPPIVELCKWARPSCLLWTLLLSVSIASASDGELHLHEGLDQKPVIAGLPSSAYNSHTAEGMRAAPYLVACVPELKAFFAERPTAKKSDCMGWAIFTVEGQLMGVTLVSPLMAEIEQFARETVVRQIGLTLAEYQELETIVWRNMPLLHRARQRIVTQIDAEAAAKAAQKSGGTQPFNHPHRDRPSAPWRL